MKPTILLILFSLILSSCSSDDDYVPTKLTDRVWVDYYSKKTKLKFYELVEPYYFTKSRDNFNTLYEYSREGDKITFWEKGEKSQEMTYKIENGVLTLSGDESNGLLGRYIMEKK